MLFSKKKKKPKKKKTSQLKNSILHKDEQMYKKFKQCGDKNYNYIYEWGCL